MIDTFLMDKRHIAMDLTISTLNWTCIQILYRHNELENNSFINVYT